MAEAVTSGLHFVFLQGMPAPFFRRIANELTALGCRATGINFCVGDALFWRGPNTVNFRAPLSEWRAFFADFLRRHCVTDIVLLGEQRSYHKPAVEIAQAEGIRVTVTDFGYLRPDWITLERDGMTGNSRFPRDPATILALARDLPRPDLERRYDDKPSAMARADLLYNAANLILAPLYPHYRRSDARPPTLIYELAGAKHEVLSTLGARRTRLRLKTLLASGPRYFLFPMQLEHDFQIVAYSPFDGMEEPLRNVMQSFAGHAAAGTRLVIKLHPWDPCIKNWRKLAHRWAAEYGIAGRIDYFDGGDLDDMIRNSTGVVTVNSTSGIRALQLGARVIALGSAVYNMAGLTYQGGLDGFWQDPWQPDPVLFDAFIRLMTASIQIRGVFFAEPGLSAAVDEAVKRLASGTVGVPDAGANAS